MSTAAGSEALFAAILSIAADAIITLDEHQRITQFNEGATRVFGYAAEEVIGQPMDMLLPPRFRARHHGHVEEFGRGRESARQMGHRREIFGLRKDGSEFPAEASIAQLQVADGHRVFSAVLRDITERKRAEGQQQFMIESSAVLTSTLDYETIIAAIPALAVRALGDWCALDLVDSSAETRIDMRPGMHQEMRHVEASRDDASPLVHALGSLYPLDADSPWPVQDVLRTGRQVTAVTDSEWLEAHTLGEAELDRLAGAGVGSLLMVPLRARDRVLGVLTLARAESAQLFDASDEALATAFASRAALALDNAHLYGSAQRATKARDETLGVVSHDLRNPLSAIAMCASALRSGSTDAPTTASLAGTIAESAEWMQRLIRDLLDIASLESGRLTVERRAERVHELFERVGELFAPVASERGITLTLESTPELEVHGDFERLLQVLANLVGNALKFTDVGGRVTVSATARAHDVLFEVADTGAGIPSEHFAHLFELYWHTQHEGRSRGSGYGLAIARGLVAAHGGQIWVDSVVGAGSRFSFTVPTFTVPTPTRQP